MEEMLCIKWFQMMETGTDSIYKGESANKLTILFLMFILLNRVSLVWAGKQGICN